MNYTKDQYMNDINKWNIKINNDNMVNKYIMNEVIPLLPSEFKMCKIMGFETDNYNDIFKYSSIIGEYPPKNVGKSDISSPPWVIISELCELCENTGIDDLSISNKDIKELLIKVIQELLEKYPSTIYNINNTGGFINRFDKNNYYSMTFFMKNNKYFHLQLTIDDKLIIH